jgi:hypothetical protein
MSNRVLSVEEIVTNYFESDLKKNVIENIITSQLKEFESKIRPIVEQECSKVTIGTIHEYRNMLDLKNEIEIRLNYHDEVTIKHEKTEVINE